jgi:hypothetical protein
VIAENFVPTTPIEAYKAIIDQLANETTRSISTKLIAEQGILSESPDEGVANEFVRSLSAEHRRILAHIVHRERVGAIHDVLALLTSWISTRGVGLTFHGEPMPVELSGMGLHGDYIGRLND